MYLVAFSITLTGVRNRVFLKITWLAILVHFTTLLYRSIVAGHPPFTSLYETILLLSFLVALRLVVWSRQIDTRYRWLVLLVVLGMISAIVFMPSSQKVARPLMPALNSFWMFVHVPAYFFGYMALILAFVYALVFLLQGKNESSSEAISLLKKMDNEIKIAFLFLNIGLVTGAIWGYISWGNYWGWDSKEVWALINILTLAFYFHLLKPKGVKKALIVVWTLLTVIFTYFGVSFLLSGLHSYV